MHGKKGYSNYWKIIINKEIEQMTKQQIIDKYLEDYKSKIDLSPIIKMKYVLQTVFGNADLYSIDNPFEGDKLKDIPVDLANNKIAITEDEFKKKYFEVQVIILFPEIVIENSKGNKHTMRDVYIKIIFDGFYRLLSFSLARGKVTEAEYLSGYMFSHISGVPNQGFGTHLCLGIGTPLSMLLPVLKTDGFDEDRFRLFLYNLKEYLKWESIEGTPYTYIKDIGKTVNRHTNSFGRTPSYSGIIGNDQNDLLIKYFFIWVKCNNKQETIANLLNVTYRSESDVDIQSTPDFEKLVVVYLRDIFTPSTLNSIFTNIDEKLKVIGFSSSLHYSFILIKDDATGNYFSSEIEENHSNLSYESTVILKKFKGKEVKLEVIKEEGQDKKRAEENRTIVPNPFIVTSILKVIKQSFINNLYYGNNTETNIATSNNGKEETRSSISNNDADSTSLLVGESAESDFISL